ncbi:stromelysin-1-like [Mantella aurantiaca]
MVGSDELKNDENLESKIENTNISETISQTQQFFSLKTTGKPDTPRCGFQNVLNRSLESRRWRKNNLTYRIVNYTSDMNRSKVDEVIEKALKVWSNVTPLTFTQVHAGTSDIKILFEKQFHNDFYPFDGPGNILGQAFLPENGVGGDVHFDDGETWTYEPTGHNLFSMAVHLLGHSLGLLHSNNSKALMFPVYKFFSTKTFQLPKEDLHRIQEIYGNQYWNFTNYVLTSDSPKDISQMGFSASVQKIDAAVHDQSKNKTYFFVDEQYWSYDENMQKMKPDCPEDIEIEFPGIEGRVDAAYARHGFLYLLNGQIQYKFDRNRTKAVVALDNLPWIICRMNSTGRS